MKKNVLIALVGFVFSLCGLDKKSFAVDKGSPVGFFYFGRYNELDPEWSKRSQIRVPIIWEDYEIRPGEFIFDGRNPSAQKISYLLSRGIKVLPSLRAKGWRVEDPRGFSCSTAPLDLNRTRPLRMGDSYSDSYYQFVRRVIEHFQGVFDLVIENEPNNPEDQWCSSVDDFFRIVLTAIKARNDSGFPVDIFNGGLTGAELNWMVIESYLNDGNVLAARSFYEKFSGENISRNEIFLQMNDKASKEIFKRAKQIYNSNLHHWVIPNFHYYQRAEALPEVVSFLRREWANIEFISNETGVKWGIVSSTKEAAKDMIKKYAYLFNLGAKLNIWFAPTGELHHNAAALIDSSGNIVEETKNAYEAVARFLGNRALSHEEISDANVVQFRFIYNDKFVRVFWPKRNENFSVNLNDKCQLYNFQNQEYFVSPLDPNQAPFFEVCERFHRVFITSTKYRGNLGGIQGANAICQRHANSAGLSGDWLAIISDRDSNARDRIQLKSSIVNFKGDVVSTADKLWSGQLENAFLYNEFGEIPLSYMRVAWTGTGPNGRVCNPNDDCQGWSSASFKFGSTGGHSDYSDARWIKYNVYGQQGAYFSTCNGYLALYCISENPY